MNPANVSPPAQPFASRSSLEHGFADGLAAMLENHRGLGVYILVLPNAAYDASLWAKLSPALSARHAELATALTDTLRRGRKLTEPEDDVLVFLKLHAIGFAHLKTMEGRRAGAWDIFFNPIRALRPPRSSGLAFETLLRPFDPAGFHFNKPFLAKEILWEGELAGKAARILYNKFPFARLHGKRPTVPPVTFSPSHALSVFFERHIRWRSDWGRNTGNGTWTHGGKAA